MTRRISATSESTASRSRRLGVSSNPKPEVLEIFDADHSDLEDRFIAIGPIDRGLVIVVFTEPEEGVIRIIGARLANKREQAWYRSQMDRIK